MSVFKTDSGETLSKDNLFSLKLNELLYFSFDFKSNLFFGGGSCFTKFEARVEWNDLKISEIEEESNVTSVLSFKQMLVKAVYFKCLLLTKFQTESSAVDDILYLPVPI